MSKILFSLAIILFCFPSARQAQAEGQAQPTPAIDNQTCLTCHADPSSQTFVDPVKFEGSIHGSGSCTDCHAGITAIPHTTPVAKVGCGSCHPDESDALMKSDHGQALKAGVDEAKACLRCHGGAHTIKTFGDKAEPAVKARVSEICGTCHADYVKSFSRTVHGQAIAAWKNKAPSCTDCHGEHGINKYTNPSSKLFWQKIPATCGGCHSEILKTFNKSVHGKAVAAGEREAPVCTDCHGEHTVASIKESASKVSPAHITETCGQCHAAERITTKYRLPNYVVNTYMESYHGLSVQRGSVTAANCASCHGTHDILSDMDPDSSIYPGNLVTTCGKCHAGIGQRVAEGKVHSGTRAVFVEHATKMVRNFYIVLIILVVGMMLVHNILDLWKKLQSHYRHMSSLGLRVRMGRSERIQHFILLVSFTALAYSGFALKYPLAWWTMPFIGAEDYRGLVHRIAALAFMMLSAYHLWFMLFTVKGRWHLKEMLPRKLDFIQFGQTFAYYFGMRKEKPRPAFYGYIEKMEYWALVWGTVIMVVTGGILMKKEWAWKYFSSGIFDAIAAVHYYEAVLACLAIIIWHLYFVIFDPDVYPMKSTWISGKSDPSDDERTS